MGGDAPAVETIPDRRHYDLYILTAPDFKFIQNGRRESESMRLEMHQWISEVLTQKDKHSLRVTGTHGERIKQAAAAMDPLLVLPPLDAP